MSRIDDLIRQYCPDGVQHRPLLDVCTDFIVPMRDRPKLFDGEVPWCRIEDIESLSINGSKIGLGVSDSVIKQMNLKVMPTGTVIASCSASLGRYAINTVPLITNQTFIGLVCGPEIYNRFLLYLLFTKTPELRSQSTAGTIAYISRSKFEALEIPVPPLEVQREIVRVLDTFQELEAVLEAELEARKKQYDFYRDSLLNFANSREGERVRWLTLGDIGAMFGGLSGKSKADFTDGNARYVTYMNVYANISTNIRPDDLVRVESGERQQRLQKGDILFTGSSETPDECGMTSVLTVEPESDLYLNSFCIGYRLHDTELLSPEFTKHLFRSRHLRDQIVRTASGVTRFNVSKVKLAKVTIPVPPLEVQAEIADVLDKFDELVNDISVGLPAELTARRQQYEHYRDRLLSFEAVA